MVTFTTLILRVPSISKSQPSDLVTQPSDFKRLGYCGADIVLKLSENLPLDHGYKLYFDDYFVYVKLCERIG